MSEQAESPKVLISYSWTNEEHIAWVLTLAERLRSDGVDVVLDLWDLKEGQDKYAFMEQMVTDPMVTKVLAICDRTYAEKADGRQGGVGTESQIISKEVYEKADQEKFIAIVRVKDENDVPCLPVFFRSRIYIDFAHDDRFEEDYDRLLRNLYRRPQCKKPPLGQPPAYLFKEDVTHVQPASQFQRLKEAVSKAKPDAEAFLREYLECYLDSLEQFRIRCARSEDHQFDDKVLASIESFTPYRDNFLEFAEFAAAHMDRDGTYDAVFGFLEQLLPFQSRPMNDHSSDDLSTDNYRFIVQELFLYWLATLIRWKRYPAAARFIEGTYHFTESLGGGPYREDGSGAFYEPIASLDEYRNHRLKLNLISVTADTMKQRATWPKVQFRDLCQVDLLLFIRPFFPEPGPAGDWYPRLLPYSHRAGDPELFARATSDRGIVPLQQLLKVKSLPDFLGKLEAMFQNQQFQRLLRPDLWRSVDLERLLSLEALRKTARPKA